MRRGSYVIFSIMLVLACCFFTGCTSSPPEAAAPQGTANAGVTFDSQTEEHLNYTYEEVTSAIYQSPISPDVDAFPKAEDMHFLSISGENLDGNAIASSWTFVVRYKDAIKFVTYDKYGETVTDWPRGYNADEVFLDKVVSPKSLFDQNRAVIFKNPQETATESRKLVLTGGNYTLIIKGQKYIRMLAFDAKTGALTSSNER